MAPGTGAYLPGSQATQAPMLVLPCSAVKRPTGQVLQAEPREPGMSWNLPLSQSEHCDSADRPTESPPRPAGQLVQVDAPSASW